MVPGALTWASGLIIMASLATSPTEPPPALPNGATAGPAPSAALSLSFGVYTTDKPTEMFKKFNPIASALAVELTRSLGTEVTIELEIFNSYDNAINALANGEVDFTRFGPASYIIAKQRNKGVKLLAMEHKGGEKRFQGVMVTSVDSDIQSIEDIRGRSFAFGDENSTIGRYLAQALLVENGIQAKHLADYEYLGRHDTVARAVEVGDFDVGSVKESTFKKLNTDGTLRVVATFDNVTKPWAARPGLATNTFKALSDALQNMDDEAVLKELKVSGFLPATDADYKLVRQGMMRSKAFGK